MDKKILITGTTSGVGLSLARYLSSRFDVVAVGRNGKKLKKLFEDNQNVKTYEVDLGVPGEVKDGLDRILDEHGYIPYLINNAGVNIKALIETLDREQIVDCLEVNAISPVMILKRLLPAMKKNDFGRVINITSGAPLNCFPEFSAYSASKGALNAYTVTAARECEEYNIKINLMSPGPVRTNMAPDAPMEPSVCHPTADYLISLDKNGPSGRFFWLGYEIPLFPDLSGIQWLAGKADDSFRKVF